MKIKTLLLIAAVISSRAMAAPNAVNVSGTITEQKPATILNNQEVGKTVTVPLKNSTVYGIISNSVANVGNLGTGLTPASLPPDGYVAYDPQSYDGMVSGVFYVTNKSGYYYPLSGFDVNSNYYSFIEFDTYSSDAAASAGTVNLGFNYNFNGVQTEHFNTNSGTGSTMSLSTAQFYVHDDPYSFDSADAPSAFYTNSAAISMCGLAKTSLQFSNGSVKSWSISFQGTGNSFMDGNIGVVQGKVSMSSANQPRR